METWSLIKGTQGTWKKPKQHHVLYLCQDAFLSTPTKEVRGDLAGETAEEA